MSSIASTFGPSSWGTLGPSLPAAAPDPDPHAAADWFAQVPAGEPIGISSAAVAADAAELAQRFIACLCQSAAA